MFNFSIEYVPTIRFFPPKHTQGVGFNSEFVNTGIKHEDRNPSILKRKLIHLLEPQLPNLLSSTNYSGDGIGALRDLWTNNNGVRDPVPTAIVLIFERFPVASYIGKEITLRLSANQNIKVVKFFMPNDIFRIYAPSGTIRLAVLFVGQDQVPKRLAVNYNAPVDSICQAVLELAGGNET